MNSFPLQTRQTLKTLGFSDNEIAILFLLFHQHKLTTKSISQQTTMSFDTVHFALHNLEQKKIIRRTGKDGEDVAELPSNDQFLAWIDEQKERNSEIYEDAKSVIGSFLSVMEESTWKPNVIYFEGRQGIIDIYEDMLDQGKDIRCWTDIQKIYDTLGDFTQDFIKRRMKKKITTYAIMPKNPMNEQYAKKDEMRNVKFSDHLPINGEIRIYGEKVAVITFHAEKPVGFVFSGSVISSVFRGLFEHAWNGCR